MALRLTDKPSEPARRLFGTDGIRGVANAHPMTGEMMLQLGRAVAYLIRNGTHRHRVVIGKDTRLSGYMLETALASGICSMGVDVLICGPLPTPAISQLTVSMRADAGAVISASHNPYQDNGIKFFNRDGFKLPDETEMKIEELIANDELHHLRPTATSIGKAFRIEDAGGRYVVFAKSTFPKDLTLEGLTIVVDCGHGAAYRVAPSVLQELGAKVITIGAEPDGKNINKGFGALHPEAMCKAVVKTGANLGIALDGDADRLIVADEKGKVVDGDAVMAVCGLDLLRRKALPKKTVVATVMSNLGLDQCIGKAGGRVVRTRVGDRYVVEEMRKNGYSFGGEQSGHLIFLEHATTGDGTVAALALLSVMVQSGKPMSELARMMDVYPQAQLNLAVREKPELGSLPAVMRAVRDVEKKLGKEGRVLVRYSGTEPKVRVLVEGPEKKLIEGYAGGIAAELKKAIGA
ncbi:MAG TPA: phosphoglucosamine mutase [Myxococcales bacterium]|jgi:phosphoglucosamine mutase|nr:phosphoglucosamine mutase [Myxococcales bacterium]